MTNETIIAETPGAKRYTQNDVDRGFPTVPVGHVREGMEAIATEAGVLFRYGTTEGGGYQVYDNFEVSWDQILDHAPTDEMRKVLRSRGEIGGGE